MCSLPSVNDTESLTHPQVPEAFILMAASEIVKKIFSILRWTADSENTASVISASPVPLLCTLTGPWCQLGCFHLQIIHSPSPDGKTIRKCIWHLQTLICGTRASAPPPTVLALLSSTVISSSAQWQGGHSSARCHILYLPVLGIDKGLPHLVSLPYE